MKMFLRSSFFAFILISLISTLDFGMDMYILRECEISEKRVKTTVSAENIYTYGVEISVEISDERKVARERRVERTRNKGERGAAPLERRFGQEGG